VKRLEVLDVHPAEPGESAGMVTLEWGVSRVNRALCPVDTWESHGAERGE
jgi:hypothetical protein